MVNAQKIGKTILDGSFHAKGSLQLFYGFICNFSSLKTSSIRTILYKQIYFTGITPLAMVVMIGHLIGMIIITQANNIMALDSMLIGKLLVWIVVRELGPLLVAILIIARSCTAMTSELGSMMIRREIVRLILREEFLICKPGWPF